MCRSRGGLFSPLRQESFSDSSDFQLQEKVLDIREPQSIFPSCGNKDLILRDPFFGHFSLSLDHSYRLTSHSKFFPRVSQVGVEP